MICSYQVTSEKGPHSVQLQLALKPKLLCSRGPLLLLLPLFLTEQLAEVQAFGVETVRSESVAAEF